MLTCLNNFDEKKDTESTAPSYDATGHDAQVSQCGSRPTRGDRQAWRYAGMDATRTARIN